MVFIHLVTVELLHRLPVLVHRHLIERHPGLQSRLVRHDVDEFQLAVCLALQIREEIGQGLVEVNHTIVIQLHDGQGRSENLGARGDVIQIVRLHPMSTAIGKGAKALVVHHVTVFHRHDLTTRISPFPYTHLGHRVQLVGRSFRQWLKGFWGGLLHQRVDIRHSL